MVLNKNIRSGFGLADPHALVEGDKVYIFCGSDKSYKTDDTWRMDQWFIFATEDLKNYELVGSISPKDTYMGDNDNNCWAGYPLKKDGHYYWFFSEKNISIGLAEADKPEGPYVDALKKPLVPQGCCKTPSYDPCVYEENGNYTIFFGAGQYYYAPLAKDLHSLAAEPKPVYVYNEKQELVTTDDKPTVFSRNGIYYLCYGSQYAMSKTLEGPYQYQGEFVGGGHNDVFYFKGKYYVCNEFHDTSIFYRGIRVVELDFHEDGRVKLAEDVRGSETYERIWDFTEGDQNWFLTNTSNARHTKEGILYEVSKEVGLCSPVFPGTMLKEKGGLKLKAHVQVKTSLCIQVEVVKKSRGFWNAAPTVLTKEITLSTDQSSYDMELDLPEEMLLRRITISGCENQNKRYVDIKSIEIC